jgi:hypothetical protein
LIKRFLELELLLLFFRKADEILLLGQAEITQVLYISESNRISTGWTD